MCIHVSGLCVHVGHVNVTWNPVRNAFKSIKLYEHNSYITVKSRLKICA